MNIYQSIISPILISGLKIDPEWLHQRLLGALNWLGQYPSTPIHLRLQKQLRQSYCLTDNLEADRSDPTNDLTIKLQQNLWGLTFPNPVGLAAGFDKDGVAANMWSSLGFGFAELGTVTYHAQPGNPQPRLFRLPSDRAALNRMGFNNQGSAALAVRLANLATQTTTQPYPIPLGINLGKSKITPLEEAVGDYVASFRLLKDYGDYFVINVSSPNTQGLRSLQSAEFLDPLLSALQQENTTGKPLLVKIAPDLEESEIAEITRLAIQYQLGGIIATNTTIDRQGLTTQVIPTTGTLVKEEAGGISGAPLREKSTEIISYIYQQTQGTLPIIGVGGIFTAADAWQKINAGASLVQIYTGWAYQGPGMVREILLGLQQQLEIYNLPNLSAAVGKNLEFRPYEK
jgi:dihydroorotate dehydrogenase